MRDQVKSLESKSTLTEEYNEFSKLGMDFFYKECLIQQIGRIILNPPPKCKLNK